MNSKVRGKYIDLKYLDSNDIVVIGTSSGLLPLKIENEKMKDEIKRYVGTDVVVGIWYNTRVRVETKPISWIKFDERKEEIIIRGNDFDDKLVIPFSKEDIEEFKKQEIEIFKSHLMV